MVWEQRIPLSITMCTYVSLHFSILISIPEYIFFLPLMPHFSLLIATLQGKDDDLWQKEIHSFHPSEVSKGPQHENYGLRASEAAMQPA